MGWSSWLTPHPISLHLFVCFFLTSSSTTRLSRGRASRLTSDNIIRTATPEKEKIDHDFCLNRSHYTDIDSTSRERATTAGIEPRTSSPGVACVLCRLRLSPPPPPFSLQAVITTYSVSHLEKNIFYNSTNTSVGNVFKE